MKINITIAFLFISCFGLSQNRTLKLFGSGGYDLNGNTERRMNGSDTIYTVHNTKFKLFKPLRLGEFTIASLPPAASCAGCIVVVPDSSYKPYVSDSTTWKEFEGSGGGGGSLPIKPNNYLLRGTGVAGYDTATGLYYDNATKYIGIGTTAPTHPMTLDKVSTVDNGGIAMYSTTDQTTNYQRFRQYLSSGNIMSFNLEHGGSGATGYMSFKIAGTEKLSIDAQQAIFAGNFLFYPDNTYTIGRLSVSPARPKSAYIGTDIQVGLPANTTTAAILHLGASTTSKPSMKIEEGVAPTSPTAGMFYVDSTDHKPYYHDGTSWYDLTATGSVADNSITNTKLADMAANTFKGRDNTGSGDPKDLTVTQVKTMLGINNDDGGEYVPDALPYQFPSGLSVEYDTLYYTVKNNIVTVGGRIKITTSSSGSLPGKQMFSIEMPPSWVSDFGDVGQCGGSASADGGGEVIAGTVTATLGIGKGICISFIAKAVTEYTVTFNAIYKYIAGS